MAEVTTRTVPVMKPTFERNKSLLDVVLPRAMRRSPLALIALAAPVIAPYAPLQQDIVHRLEEPTPAHWLGTDTLGRDILSRILHGARISIPVGIAAVVLAAILGTAIGSIAGFVGGILDEVMMRVK